MYRYVFPVLFVDLVRGGVICERNRQPLADDLGDHLQAVSNHLVSYIVDSIKLNEVIYGTPHKNAGGDQFRHDCPQH